MVAYGDSGKKAWALEAGWLRNTNIDLGSYNWMKVSEQEQAQYLTRALQKASTDWPWLQLAFVWNLDFSRYYPATSEKYWFSVEGTQVYDRLVDFQTPVPTATPTATPTSTPTGTPTPTNTPTTTPTPSSYRLYLPLVTKEAPQ